VNALHVVLEVTLPKPRRPALLVPAGRLQRVVLHHAPRAQQVISLQLDLQAVASVRPAPIPAVLPTHVTRVRVGPTLALEPLLVQLAAQARMRKLVLRNALRVQLAAAPTEDPAHASLAPRAHLQRATQRHAPRVPPGHTLTVVRQVAHYVQLVRIPEAAQASA
jgi:hypothetical protein